MNKPKVLFICGSPNQTSQMHQISREMHGIDAWFTPYYGSGYILFLTRIGLLDFTIMGGEFKRRALEYFRLHDLRIDIEGRKNKYDLVITCQDLIIPSNIRGNRIILVQEGMTDPETAWYRFARLARLPRWSASTAMTGLSHAYDLFCVASDGYKDLFISKGISPDKLKVTGIPNFDNFISLNSTDFPHSNFVLVATSDMRETYKYENRKEFIKKAVEIADGRKLIFKLHPNENAKRATAEINRFAPGALVYHDEPIEKMIPKCDILITRYSSVAYKALALGKKVISDIPVHELRSLLPLQNGGISAKNIAAEAARLLEDTNKNQVYSYNKNLRWKPDLFQKLRNKIKLARAKQN